MPGLQQAILNYGRGAAGIGERLGMGIGKFIGGVARNPFANRTAIGATGGALLGGMSADRGNGLRGALVGAGLGAAGARYGGAFMKAGMTSGIGLGMAGRITMATGRRDFRMAMSQGRSAASLIGNTMTSGYSRIRGLFR